MITVNPCIVSSLTTVDNMGDMTYTIGDPDLTQGTYSFQDLPNSCGYDQTIVVVGLPTFAMHDDSAREFTVFETFDHSLIGSYNVAI